MDAMVLKGYLDKHGWDYKALNCYNGKVDNNPYSRKVFINLRNLKQERKVIK